MNTKVVINAACCGNTMAEVISDDYQAGHHYDRLLKCLSCGKPISEHIDLTSNKIKSDDQHLLSSECDSVSDRDIRKATFSLDFAKNRVWIYPKPH